MVRMSIEMGCFFHHEAIKEAEWEDHDLEAEEEYEWQDDSSDGFEPHKKKTSSRSSHVFLLKILP